jgi:hypothetical protein
MQGHLILMYDYEEKVAIDFEILVNHIVAKGTHASHIALSLSEGCSWV